MSDELVTALLKEHNLRVVLTTTGELSREARRFQEAHSTSASLLAQGLTAALLMGALQKNASRLNLQLECDGPMRGLFADANSLGEVRGYIKNALLSIENTGAFRWRPALGNSGFLSVLRDLGKGEYYRSSVELVAFDIARDVERYFTLSEQLEAAVAIAASASGDEALAQVAGVLVQPLPDGDREELERIRRRLHDEGALEKALNQRPGQSAAQLLTALFERGDVEVMSRMPALLRCDCSRERVLRALVVLGRDELKDMIAKEGRAEVRCEFCSKRYTVERDELQTLLDGLTA